MSVKTVIGFPNQFAVEALFAPAGLVSRYKQNRLAPSGSLLGISKTKRQTADRKEIEGVARVLPSSALLQCVQAQFFSQTLLG